MLVLLLLLHHHHHHQYHEPTAIDTHSHLMLCIQYLVCCVYCIGKYSICIKYFIVLLVSYIYTFITVTGCGILYYVCGVCAHSSVMYIHIIQHRTITSTPVQPYKQLQKTQCSSYEVCYSTIYYYTINQTREYIKTKINDLTSQ